MAIKETRYGEPYCVCSECDLRAFTTLSIFRYLSRKDVNHAAIHLEFAPTEKGSRFQQLIYKVRQRLG